MTYGLFKEDLTMLKKSLNSALAAFALVMLVFVPAYGKGKTETVKAAELQMTLRNCGLAIFSG